MDDKQFGQEVPRASAGGVGPIPPTLSASVPVPPPDSPTPPALSSIYDLPRKGKPGRPPKAAETPHKRDFQGKKSTVHDDVMWVYQNMGVADLKPADAPSAGAWWMWEECQSNPKFLYDVFAKGLLPKVIPSQAAIDREALQKAKNEKVGDMIVRLQVLSDGAYADETVQ